MELNTIWKGQLCHKTKTIAEVIAKSKKDCPVEIPQNLDVHQKVKYEEFSEKVMKKSNGSLTLDNYINQDDHCLMVVIFIPTSEKSILSSFMAFLIKTQSVGVSVLGENESVIFLVPSGLVSDNVLPPLPGELEIHAGTNVLFGVIKISKMILHTTECGKSILEELPPIDVKPVIIGATDIKEESDEKEETSTSENNEVQTDVNTYKSPKSNEVPDSLSENSKNLTRLSVYMSNLPLLSDRANYNVVNPEKDMFASQLKVPRKKLSLKDYKRRLENRGCQSPGLPDLNTDVDNTCDNQEVEKASENVDTSTPSKDFNTICKHDDISKVPNNEPLFPVMSNETNTAILEKKQGEVKTPEESKKDVTQQIQNEVTSPKIKAEKLDTEYYKYDKKPNEVKLVIKKEEEEEVEQEEEEEENNENDSEEEDLGGELPDLGADSESDMDTEEQSESQNNPGDSISFKSTETVIFKPKIYSRVLEDLDTLKCLLGDTAKINSTLHRERCMQLVDMIGDKLIGNRKRKKCTVRSIGYVTELTENKQKVLVNSEMQTDNEISEKVSTTEQLGHESQIIDEKVSTTTDNLINDNTELDVCKTLPDTTNTTKDDVKEEKRNKGNNESLANGKANKTPVLVHSETSDDEGVHDDTEGYFTMLLKLNGALDDLPKKKSQSKTIKRTVTTSSYRVATQSSFSTPTVMEPLSRDPHTNVDYDRTGGSTPETGAQPYEGNNVVQLIDGRLRFQSNYNSHSKEQSDEQLPQYDRPWSSSGYESGFTSDLHSESGYSHNSYTSKPLSNKDNEMPNDFNPHIINVKDHNNMEKSNHQSLSNPSYDSRSYARGNNSVLPYRDIDLRNDSQVYSNAVYPVDTYQNVTPSQSITEPSSGFANSNNIYPSSVSGTIDTTYYTEVVHDVHDEIDKDMENEMIDILEILHEGTAAEQASLKKPKGRSKRARRKRRAIAEAEKLFSLVSLAEKIESQHKLSVLSEKQKKREFYKKIIQTYATKGPDNKAPKDEETMIMECVEQLMEEADKEMPCLGKSISSDKRKSTEDIDFSFDNYEGLSEKKKKKYNDDDDCKIVEQLRLERREVEKNGGKRFWAREKGRSQNFTSKKYNSRSCSSERKTWSGGSPERLKRKELPKGKRSTLYPKTAHVDMSPDQKHQMFEMWPDVRYINHLFITANKITYGNDNGRPWLLKVKSCVNSIADRRISVKRRLDCISKDFNAKDISFSKRDKLYQDERDNLKNLKNLDFLASLFNYYQCKFIIVDTLQQISKAKPNNPNHFKAVLVNLRDKLKVEKDNLAHSEKDATAHSDRKLIKKAQEECQEMLDNIKATKKKIQKTAPKVS